MLSLCEETLGPDNLATVRVLSSLALLYNKTDAYTDARHSCSACLRSTRKCSGPSILIPPRRSRIAEALNNLAELYRNPGAYPKAEPLYERALVILETASGPRASRRR